MDRRSPNIVFVTPEATPFYKTGGLGNVCGELPLELAKMGLDVRVILLRYASMRDQSFTDTGLSAAVEIAGKARRLKIWTAEHQGVAFYFLEDASQPSLVSEAYRTETLRGAILLSEGALSAIRELRLDGQIPQPDLIHAHDWQAGLIPVLLKTKYSDDAILAKVASAFTIHNLEYRGDCLPYARFQELGIGPQHWFGLEQDSDRACFSIMRGALFHADRLNTVSVNHAKELLTPRYANYLLAALTRRKRDFCGILNGVDYSAWQPIGELAEKPAAKELLQKELSFRVDPTIPLFGMVARIARQKAVGEVLAAVEELLLTGIDLQFVFFGKGHRGDNYYQNIDRQMQRLSQNPAWRDRLACRQDYTTPEELRLFRGIDIFVYPSEHEPCGIAPMVALLNGSPAVVRRTGGLIDNFRDYDPRTKQGNAFMIASRPEACPMNENGEFEETGGDVAGALLRAINCFRHHDHWQAIVGNALPRDLSWKRPAEQYLKLYGLAVNERRADVPPAKPRPARPPT